MVAAVVVVGARSPEGYGVARAGRDVAGVPATVLGRDRMGVLAVVHPTDGRPRLDVDRLGLEVIVIGTDAGGRGGPAGGGVRCIRRRRVHRRGIVNARL